MHQGGVVKGGFILAHNHSPPPQTRGGFISAVHSSSSSYVTRKVYVLLPCWSC